MGRLTGDIWRRRIHRRNTETRIARVKSVVFIDPPAFCTTVERLVAPALRSRPIAVAPPLADRGTVLALSPEAEAAGAEALPGPGAPAAYPAALRPRLPRPARDPPGLRAHHRAPRLRPLLPRSHRHRAALRPGGGGRGADPARGAGAAPGAAPRGGARGKAGGGGGR